MWGKRQLVIAALGSFPPISKQYTTSSTHRTSTVTKLSEGGIGDGNELVRQAHRKTRAKKKTDQFEYDLETHRGLLLRNGVYSCTRRCPISNRYCRRQYLSSASWNLHLSRNKCSFPTGISACDRLVFAAATPGGMLTAGSHHNRGKNTALFKRIDATPIGTPGSEDAKCFGKFHRPKDKKAYTKPQKLVQVLQRLFLVRPVLTAKGAYDIMKLMTDTDGSCLFDYRKRGELRIFAQNTQEYKDWIGCSLCGTKPCSQCNGKLIPIEDIKSYFKTCAKTRKNKDTSKSPATGTGTQLSNNNNTGPTPAGNLVTTYTETSLMALVVPALKLLCRERKLTQSGRKAELVQKILAYDMTHTQQSVNTNNINL